MNSKIISTLTLIILLAGSCVTPKNISNYYLQNQSTLDDIQESYSQLSRQGPFSIEFTDKTFNHVSIEIFTDTVKYIYEFGVTEKRMADTLIKYKLPAESLQALVLKMQMVHCTWINNLDYYVGQQKEKMVFMSMRPKPLNIPFTNKKYYILAYFAQPQYYNKDGILLDRRSRKRLRKINEDVFRRITDKVAYTLSDRYR